MSKVDICDQLRLAPANLIGTDDEERYWVCHDAAREIESLRLTDEEREAIGRAAVHYERQYDDYRDVTDGDTAKTLRAFLCRAR